MKALHLRSVSRIIPDFLPVMVSVLGVVSIIFNPWNFYQGFRNRVSFPRVEVGWAGFKQSPWEEGWDVLRAGSQMCLRIIVYQFRSLIHRLEVTIHKPSTQKSRPRVSTYNGVS